MGASQLQQKGYLDVDVDPTLDLFEEIEKLKRILHLAREQKENQVAAAAQKMLRELEAEVNLRPRRPLYLAFETVA